MRSLRDLAERASSLRVPLSMVLKSELGREVLARTAGVAGLVLQGGGAVHHVYGSPRFSADLDFAQQGDFEEKALALGLSAAAEVASGAWGACVLEPASSRGRLYRQKLRVRLDAATSHVLSIERYEVPSREPQTRPVRDGRAAVLVESPAEIIADKLVAACDRIRTRGTTKLRDVFDIAFLADLGRPTTAFVEAKLSDYGYPVDLSPLRRLLDTLDEVLAERLRAELRDVLPREDADRLDPPRIVATVKALLAEVVG